MPLQLMYKTQPYALTFPPIFAKRLENSLTKNSDKLHTTYKNQTWKWTWLVTLKLHMVLVAMLS